MAHSGKTITFATDLLPNEDNVYSLGASDQRWKIHGDIQPIQTKTYENVIATLNTSNAVDQETGGFFYAKIHPTAFNVIWHTKFKVTVYVPGQNNYHAVSIYEVWGMADTYMSYKCQNAIRNISYRPIYYNTLFRAKEAGYNNNLGHWAGFSLLYSTNPNNTSYKRTVQVQLLEYDNCTVEMQNSLITSTNIPSRNTTNYVSTNTSYDNFDFYNNGLRETGDDTANDIDRTTQELYYFRYRTGAAGVGRYTLLMEESTGVYSSITTTFATKNDPTTRSNIAMNTGVKYRPDRILYFNQNVNRAANTNIGNNAQYFTQYDLIDLRFTFKLTAGSLTAYQPFYMVGTLDDQGLFTIADADNAWTQTLPSSANGKVYIFLGMVYPDNSTYRIEFELQHPIYGFINGKLREIQPGDATSVNGHTVAIDVPSTAIFTDHYAWDDITNKPTTLSGYGITDAMAGNTNVNHVFQDAVTYTDYTNWRPLIWGNSNSATEGFTPADSTAGVFSTASLTCQPSTGTIRLMNLKLMGSASSAITYTDGTTSKEMIKFIKGDANGHAIKIGGGALTVVGGGESAQSISPSVTAEHLYLLADNTIYIEANANTLANRVGFAITTDGAIVPMKAESTNNNQQDIGTSSNKWANIYATTFDGSLIGNVTGNLTGNVTGNVSGTASNVTGTVAVTNGGTGVTTVDDIFATYGVEYIVGTQTGTKATNWTGQTKSTELYVGKTIAYQLPIAGDGSATLELTFPDGTTTGQKAVYAGNTRLTTHYPANSIMIMVWNGTNWRTNPYYNTNTNTLMRTYALSPNIEFPILAGSQTTAGAWTTDYTSSYKDLYGIITSTTANRATINPSTGHITAPAGITADITGDVTGNADTATKLAASKTIWGQNFDGSANVTGNMTNVGPSLKLPADAGTDFYFLKSDSKAADGYFGKLALNTTYANADLTNYVLDVLGAVRIKLPGSSTTSSRKFIITRGDDNKNLSIGVSGIQAYDNTTTSLLYLQYYGGNLQIGTADTASATRDLYGVFDFKSTSGFKYSGMGTETTSIARPIWFMAATNSTTLDTGRPVYNSNFTYNPFTRNVNFTDNATITVSAGKTLGINTTTGKLTLSATTGGADFSTTTGALTVSTTTAALTISTTDGALEAKSTGTGTVKLTGTSGAMTISTTTGALTIQTNSSTNDTGDMVIQTAGTKGTITLESKGASILIKSKTSTEIDATTSLSLTSTTSTSLAATTTMSITSTTSTSISATTTMSITGTQGTTITSGSGYATVFKINTTEYGRFNTNGMFQLNDTGTQNTHKLYVNGDSAFNGKIAIGEQSSNAIIENVYMQWNETDQSLDFIFA